MSHSPPAPAPAAALFALLAVALAVPATAEDFDRSGFYVGGGGTWATPLFEDEIENAVGTPIDLDDSFGANAQLGYRIFSFLALEAGYEWVDSFDLSVMGVDALELEGHVVTGNLKLLAPTWRIQPYLLAGAGVAFLEARDTLGLGLDADATPFAGRLGGGIDFYVTKHVLLNVGAGVVLTTEKIDDDLTAQDVDNIHYVTVNAGLQVRF